MRVGCGWRDRQKEFSALAATRRISRAERFAVRTESRLFADKILMARRAFQRHAQIFVGRFRKFLIAVGANGFHGFPPFPVSV